MTLFTKDEGKGFKMPPGTYRHSVADGIPTAAITCPQCGIRASLSDHEIASDGTVSPSVVCDCGFHEFITLDGWQPDSTA